MTSSAGQFSIIACVDRYYGYKCGGQLLWHCIPEGRIARAWFREQTDESVLIMSDQTYHIIGSLAENRSCIVVDSDEVISGVSIIGALTATPVVHVRNLQTALTVAYTGDRDVFVVGGDLVVQQALIHPDLERVYLSIIGRTCDCQYTFPYYLIRLKLMYSHTSSNLSHHIYIGSGDNGGGTATT